MDSSAAERATSLAIDEGFTDQIHFEVMDYGAAVRLTQRVGRTRSAGLLCDESCVVAAVLDAEPNDLAVLLRDVEAWIEEESLGAIRFLLDNRIYVLAARIADSSPFRPVPIEEVDESPRAA
jgi:hypothetical protein